MAKRLQIRGGTTAQHSTFTGATREITVDTDKDTLVVHDGATAGGFPLAKSTDTDLVNDTTPQLGGQLDVNGQSIGDGTNELVKFTETASAVNELTITNAATGNGPELSATGGDTNIDLKLTPKGTGKLNLDGIKFPNADGTANQLLQTDGSGNLSFADAASGGTDWQSTSKTANFTAVSGKGYLVDTTSNTITATLPSSPSFGDIIEFLDLARKFGTNSFKINSNSNNFQGSPVTDANYGEEGTHLALIYTGSTKGWLVLHDDPGAVNNPVSIETLVVAGGGGGATGNQGGAGAGGFRTQTTFSPNAGTVLTLTVGAGGGSGAKGGNSSISGTGISTFTSTGGGTGSQDGGSGGGSTYGSSTDFGQGNIPAVSPSQGNDGGGGSRNSQPYGAAGGGGSANAGGDGNNTGGNGGNGTSNSITGSAVTYAGGGGGSAENTSTTASGGNGGGGNGGTNNTGANAGSANLGGGGGSGFNSQGNGGSGVVILKVATTDYSGTSTGSPTISTSGSNTILKFTSSGTYTV